MCGIICYVGREPAMPVLLDGLKRLEYRGYDSSGLAVFQNGGIYCHKVAGKVSLLESKLNGTQLQSTAGIAHTRWATHGQPSVANAHPHSDCQNRIFVVHNGIIENYNELKQELLARGHQLRSQTDTEVLAHLIEESLNGSLLQCVASVLRKVRGTYAVGVMSSDHPQQIVVARQDSPLLLGVSDGSLMAASDASAFNGDTREAVYLENGDVALLSTDGYKIMDLERTRVTRRPQVLEHPADRGDRGSFAHFMLKEIWEQPTAIRNAMSGRLLAQEGAARLDELEPLQRQLAAADRLVIVACGTSYYAALLGKYLIEAVAGLSVDVELASEFRYRDHAPSARTVVLAISQSGETADTLAAIRDVKRRGATVIGLVNVAGSSIAREAHVWLHCRAGWEVGVASTKSFLSQMTLLYLMALWFGRQRMMTAAQGKDFARELESSPDRVREVLDASPGIIDIAKRYAGYMSFLYLGRKYSYPVAMEGALKLKEVSYVHAEGFAAGEMKHGPIALVDTDVPSICLAPEDSSQCKMISNIEEIKARNGLVIGVGTGTDAADICDDWIEVPRTAEMFSPLVTVVPLQLLAYYVAFQRGCEIDQPRNLAKSVTVE